MCANSSRQELSPHHVFGCRLRITTRCFQTAALVFNTVLHFRREHEWHSGDPCRRSHRTSVTGFVNGRATENGSKRHRWCGEHSQPLRLAVGVISRSTLNEAIEIAAELSLLSARAKKLDTVVTDTLMCVLTGYHIPSLEILLRGNEDKGIPSGLSVLRDRYYKGGVSKRNRSV